MGITVERKYSLNETNKYVEAYLKHFENNVLYETICCVNDKYPTYVTYVRAKDKKLITRGNGKGIGEQSRLSSIFESIEHSFYEPYFFQNFVKLKNLKFLKYKKLLKYMEKDFIGNPLYENMREVESINKLPCQKYVSLISNKQIYLPLFMYGPSYPYPALNANEAIFINSVYINNNELIAKMINHDNLKNYEKLNNTMKYCSSVGGAAGIDLVETLLHALNEVIERDTTSEFLLSAIIYKNYKKYSFIDKDTLDESNKSIISFVEEKYGLELVIVDITGSIGIPTVMVYEKNNKYGNETLYTGYGTSTNISYAIERALLEYKQTIDLVLYDGTLPKDDNYLKELEKNNVNPFFKELYYFDYKKLEVLKTEPLSTLYEKYSEFTELIGQKDMLNTILRKLRKNGFEVYNTIRRLRVKRNKYIYYTKVVVPQMCDITDPGPLRMPNRQMLIRVKCEIK